MEVLIEYGKILLPASVVLYAMYLVVRSFIIKEIEAIYERFKISIAK